MKTRSQKIFLIGLIVVFAGCTQERPAQFPDGQGEDLFEKSMLASAEMTLVLSEEARPRTEKEKLQPFGEMRAYRVESVEGPEALRPVFRDLYVQAESRAAIRVRFEVNKKYVTALKLVTSEAELPAQEKQILIASADALRVPIFKLPVKGTGILVRSKNDLNEETRTLRFKETELSEATHIQIPTRASDRLEIAASDEDEDEIFSKNAINEAVFEVTALPVTINIRSFFAQDGLVLTRLDGECLQVYEITRLSLLTDKEKEDLALNPKEALPCAPAVLEKIISISTGLISPPEDCVLVRRLEVGIAYTRAALRAEEEGILSPDLQFRDGAQSESTDLIRIQKNPPIRFAERGGRPEPIRAVEVEKLKNQEFILRRTLQDSPNSLDFAFPGAAGNLDIVRFGFEKDRVNVVKADPLVQSRGGGSSRSDVETVMSMPARYFRKITADANGAPLAYPQFLRTDHTDPRAIAEIEWDQNSMPNLNSPLDYYSFESCFDGVTSRQLMGMDQRLSEGILNFTLEYKYQASRGNDCAGVFQAGYFDAVQSNFTFQERISFKRHLRQSDTPLLDIPYEAQKKLGFGLFTYKKVVPNSAGNTGVVGTEIPLPALFDLRGGRQITYVLAGLPKDGITRRAIVQTTREVIADWNKAFRLAFRGTPLERKDDVLILQVPGEDIAESAVGQMGDLDKNFIYYVEKKTGSGIIGLGGSHPNPRSGVVEAASVFVYGGNIFSYVEFLKKMSKAKENYRQIMEELSKEAAPPVEPGPSPEPSEAPDGAQPATASLPPSTLATRLKKEGALSASNAVRRLSESLGDSTKRLTARLRADQRIVFEALEEALESRSLTDSRSVELLVLKSAVKNLRGTLSREKLARLQAKLRQKESIHALLGRLEKAGICVYQANESPLSSKEIAEKEDLDLMVAVFKPTLAHEIGHNLGLRHNFIASFDKGNWKFDSDDVSNRDYSSVMDYLANDHETYDGLGPQDVASLRAAYAGLVELHPEVLGLVREGEGGKKVIATALGEEVEVLSDRFVRLADYQKALRVDWERLTRSHLGILPLKTYAFCSDEEAELYPTCNRFDVGSTPAEIVQAIADDYRSLYALRNFPNDRLDFSLGNLDRYIGRLIAKLLPARQFLEETFYQAISGAPSAVVRENVAAAVQTLFFLHEIARTPDAAGFMQGEGRFAVFKSKKGKIPVERKWLESKSVDSDSDQLRVMGIEYDKVIALLLLTERELGFPRYEAASLRISFPQLEKILEISVDSESKDGLLTLDLLKSNLMDNTMPLVSTVGGGAVFLTDGRFKVSTNELLRFFSIKGALLNLDIEGLEVSDNFSSLFRVMSGFKAPKQVRAVMPPGASMGAAGELKYWSFEEAASAISLVGRVALLEDLVEMKPKMEPLLKDWVLKTEALSQTEKPEEQEKLKQEIEKTESKTNRLISRLPQGAGPEDMKTLGNLVLSVIAKARQIQKLQDQVPPSILQFILHDTQTQLENLGKRAPLIALGLELLPAEELGLPILSDLLPVSTVEFDRAILFRNTATLNEVFYLLRPEYNR